MILRLILSALIYLFLHAAAYAQKLPEEKLAKINALIQQHDSIIAPGLAVGIVQNAQIVYTSYQGYANLEHQVKIGPNTRFNIASNAKQYTALCILKLVEEGRLKLEDDFRVYLDGYLDNIKEPIPIYQLLNHTSGIRDVYNLWALQGKTWWKLFIDNNDALTLLKNQTALNFNPGTDYLYSNSNYILLAAVVEKITGQSFANYAKFLFDGLDLTETSFLTNYMQVIPNKARPYGNWNGWKEYPAITELHGDGGLFSTLDDQLKYEVLLQKKYSKILSNNILIDVQEPLELSQTKNYGYGLMFDNYKGQKMIYHDGNTGAYNATFLRFPEASTTIVVLSNSGSVSTHYVAKKIANILLDLSTIKTTTTEAAQKENTRQETPPTFSIDYKQGLNGTFYNEETNTEIKLSYTKENSYSLNKNGRIRNATLNTKDLLRMNSYTIRINRDRKGEIKGLLVDNNRIRNVVFVKQ